MSAFAPALPVDHRDVRRTSPRRRPRLGLGLLLAVVLAFAAFSLSRMLPPQPYGLAEDWRVFYAAGSVIHGGGNPYNAAVIHDAEQVADRYPTAQTAIDDFANPPIVGWVLQPFSLMPFWISFVLATAFSLAAAATALFLWLRRWGWSGPARWAIVGLFSWPVLLGVYNGQFDLVLLSLAVASMALAIRRHPVAAGAVCMAAVVVKPHILWPLPILLTAAQLPRRRAAVQCIGAAAATALAAILGGELLMPGSTSAFLTHLAGFGSRIATTQPDLAGLPAMVQHLPLGGVLAAGITLAGGAATLAFAVFWSTDHRALALSADRRVALGVGVGLVTWLVASPYSHPNDDVLLFPLLALVLGADAVGATDRNVARAAAGCALLTAAFILSPYTGGALTVGAAILLWRHRMRVGRDGVAAASLVALALLPAVWPFHLLAVSLTPLAVLLLAIAAVTLVRATLAGQPAAGEATDRASIMPALGTRPEPT